MEQSGKIRHFTVGSNLYCLLPNPVAKIPVPQATELDKLDLELNPVTIINWAATHFTDHDVNSISENFSMEDDVWCRDFLSGELVPAPCSRG